MADPKTVDAMDPKRLDEPAFYRAWRDTHLWSTRTFWSALWLLICAGFGGLVFSEREWADDLGAFVIGPISAAIVGLIVVLVIRLLLTLRVQRNELRNEVRRLMDSASKKPGEVSTNIFVESGGTLNYTPSPGEGEEIKGDED